MFIVKDFFEVLEKSRWITGRSNSYDNQLQFYADTPENLLATDDEIEAKLINKYITSLGTI